MIGLYENFPNVHHGIARFLSTVSTQDLQRILLQFVHTLNEIKESPSLAEFVRHKVKVEFDAGIADGLSFYYLDEERFDLCINEISRTTLPVLDLYIVVRYYVPNGNKRKPLKFDYYLVRMQFREQELEMFMHHEKGPRHIAVEELIKLFFNRINRELKNKGLNPLEHGLIRAV